MQARVLSKILVLAIASLITNYGFSQRLSVGVFGGLNNHQLTFDWVTPVNVISQNTPKWKTPHFGATAKLKLYQGISIRSDLYYFTTKTDFAAEYKVLDAKWRADASFSQNTFNVTIAPQLNFGPRGIGYVYGGLNYEIQGGSDFSKGVFTTFDNPNTTDFANDKVVNTVNPAVVLGLGLHPRFGRYGLLLDARYTRSRAEAVHPKVPRLGRESFLYSAGFTYDFIE